MELFTLGEVARIVNVPPYKVSYAISVGLLPDTAMRLANKRCFTQEEVNRVLRHFRPEIEIDGPEPRKGEGCGSGTSC